MRIKQLIILIVTNPQVIRLGMFALVLSGGVIWGSVQRDGIIWGN